MLDPKFIRENAETVKLKSAQKNKKPELVDQWLALDARRVVLKQEIDELNSRRNQIAELLKDATKRTPEVIAEGKQLKETLEPLETEYKQVDEEWNKILILIPNMHIDETPVGKDESENVVIRQVGERPEFDFELKDHIELGEELDIIDVKVAGEVVGSRFNYLKGDLARLEMALNLYVFNELTNSEVVEKIAKSVDANLSTKPFVPVIPPVMIKPEVYTKTARLDPGQEEERFYIPSDNLYLIGSAEHTLAPMHINETIDEARLPLRYIGFSTAFRREAGSYGRDVRGILRVHQFDKLEAESFTKPEDGIKEQDFIVAIQEHLLQKLELPYQVIQICTGDMGGPDARQIDIETWIPTQNKYRETHTSDYIGDYQARRLNTKLKRKNGETELVHMNDATVFAIGRIVIAIVENNQQKDGSIRIPKVLVPFMGKEFITKRDY